MKAITIVLVAGLSMSGCAQMFTSKTMARYVTPDGRIIEYQSDKEQVGLLATYEDEFGRKVHISVEKSGTPEAVIQSVLQLNLKYLSVIEAVAGAAAAGATKKPMSAPAPSMRMMQNTLPCGLNVNETVCDKYIPEKIPLRME
jgi:hypothetical protein